MLHLYVFLEFDDILYLSMVLSLLGAFDLLAFFGVMLCLELLDLPMKQQ